MGRNYEWFEFFISILWKKLLAFICILGGVFFILFNSAYIGFPLLLLGILLGFLK